MWEFGLFRPSPKRTTIGLTLCRKLLLAPRRAQNRQVGVSIFPRRKEIFVALSTLRRVARDRRRARKAQMRERVQRRERRVATIIENLLKFRRRFRPAPQFQVGLA